ncbi:MAG: hypothetical protein AB1779_08325, partial [Candidatus Thermoplasmatota archaeon]
KRLERIHQESCIASVTPLARNGKTPILQFSIEFAMLSIVFAASIKVQNGVYHNIGSIAYIT